MRSDEGLKKVQRFGLPIVPVFNWSVGNWMEQFFDGLKERKLVAVKCGECGRVYLPPRMICERCFVKNEEWVEIPETGTVLTYTVAHVRVGDSGDLEDLDEPQVIAMVRHDGADTCITARCDAANCSAGMRVQVVWNDSADSVLDAISSYRPIG